MGYASSSAKYNSEKKEKIKEILIVEKKFLILLFIQLSRGGFAIFFFSLIFKYLEFISLKHKYLIFISRTNYFFFFFFFGK